MPAFIFAKQVVIDVARLVRWALNLFWLRSGSRPADAELSRFLKVDDNLRVLTGQQVERVAGPLQEAMSPSKR